MYYAIFHRFGSADYEEFLTMREAIEFLQSGDDHGHHFGEAISDTEGNLYPMTNYVAGWDQETANESSIETVKGLGLPFKKIAQVIELPTW